MFLEMSPVSSERFLTEEELAECRRRAERPNWHLAAYIAVPVLVLVVAMVLRENQLVQPWVSFALLLVGFVFLAIGSLRVRDLHVEKQTLSQVGKSSKVLRFENRGYWPPSSHFTAMGPPERIDVLLPQQLVIATDGRKLRTFKPIFLTPYNDLPWPEVGVEERDLHERERDEIEKRVREFRFRYWSNAVFLGISFVTALVVGIAKTQEGGSPGFVYALAAMSLWLLWIEIRTCGRMMAELKRARDLNRVQVSWEGDLLREHLLPDKRLWRDETGPADWRKRGSNAL